MWHSMFSFVTLVLLMIFVLFFSFQMIALIIGKAGEELVGVSAASGGNGAQDVASMFCICIK